MACKYDLYDFVKALIDQKIDVNPVDKKKNTPLYYAKNKYPKIVKLMKENKGLIDWRIYM